MIWVSDNSSIYAVNPCGYSLISSMSGSFSKILRSSSTLKLVEEANGVEKQGIVSILRSDCERSKVASLRRTLSADMSSKKWLAQNGLSSMKKIASSEELATFIEDPSSSSSEDEDERPGQFEIWNAIQSQEKNKKDSEKSGQFDIWSSVLIKKAEENSGPPSPPYIPPLVKRSTSSLSEKSLEICTESLGSETGSDGFSSPSDTEEEEEGKESHEVRVAKYNYAMCKKPPQRSFPPPLPSLARRDDGPSVHMRSHRNNGRLVLEAVSIPSQNYFHAQREDGRLVLTFVNTMTSSNDEKLVNEDDFEEEFVSSDEGEVEESEEPEPEEPEDETEEVEEEKVYKVINVHAPPLMMKKLMGLAYRTTTWPHKFNKVIDFETGEEEPTLVPKSLPSPPRVARLLPPPPSATLTSFNPYDYCWRTKPVAAVAAMAATTLSPPLKNNINKSILSKSSPKGTHDFFVPLVKGCKESRRSLLIWESYCIATT